MGLENLRRSGHRTGAMQVAALALACTIAVTGPGRAQSRNPDEWPMPVVTASATPRTVPIYLRGIGTAVASRTIVVRSGTGGELTAIDVTPGQRVQAGDLLARVDSRAAQARLDKEIALRDRDQALPRQRESILKADEARVSAARADLDATYIRAPASGIVGHTVRQVGDKVRPGDETGIVTIGRTEPIAVILTPPKTIVHALRKKLIDGSLEVKTYGHDKLTPLAEGRLLHGDEEDPQDPDKDQLVATFPNRDHALSPGMRVEVLVPAEGTRTALAIPLAAVRHSAAGYYTYLVTMSGTAHIRPLVLGDTNGEYVVVQEGLRPGDVVVTDGQDQLIEGRRVAIVVGPSPGGPPR